jgi:leader peptidase (prepilin peptidase)/N-methyltransferase
MHFQLRSCRRGDNSVDREDAEAVRDLSAILDPLGRQSKKMVRAMAALGFAVEVLIGWRIGPTAALPAYLFVGFVGCLVALVDAIERRIPNALLLPSYPIAFGLLVIASAFEGKWFALVRGGVGMFLLATFYLVLALVRSGELGFGDVKLAGWLGLILGWLGWRVLVVGAIAGPALGALGAVALLAGHRGGKGTSFPFGPFLIAGALVGILIR